MGVRKLAAGGGNATPSASVRSSPANPAVFLPMNIPRWRPQLLTTADPFVTNSDHEAQLDPRHTNEDHPNATLVKDITDVSHLLHTKQLSRSRALLDKLGNVEGEVRDRLIDLNVMLPGGGRPDAVMAFLKPSQQPHPRLRIGATPVLAQPLFP